MLLYLLLHATETGIRSHLARMNTLRTKATFPVEDKLTYLYDLLLSPVTADNLNIRVEWHNYSAVLECLLVCQLY